MRRLTPLALATLAVLAPAWALADPAPTQPLLAPEAAGQATTGLAAAAPLHDMNLMRQKIPPVLMMAMVDPYAQPASLNCNALASQVDGLNGALGDDYDTMAQVDDSREAKRSRLTREGLHVGSEALLPFSGFIRRLSGASKHDRLVMNAIMSGQARRAYLKGLGEARGCAAPARPVHLARGFDEGGSVEPPASN